MNQKCSKRACCEVESIYCLNCSPMLKFSNFFYRCHKISCYPQHKISTSRHKIESLLMSDHPTSSDCECTKYLMISKGLPYREHVHWNMACSCGTLIKYNVFNCRCGVPGHSKNRTFIESQTRIGNQKCEACLREQDQKEK